MKTLIAKLEDKEDLTPQEITEAMQTIMTGKADKEEISSFLLALREKGPSIDEITAAAKIMRQYVLPVKSKQSVVLDTCGTGGDKKGTFNISTLVALVAAGAGVAVAKHGNRSVSSQCGSADILEALGVNLDLAAQELAECLDKVGLAFLFAQNLHPAMKHAASARKALGVETIFNLLGPLTNPAFATHQMMGVYQKDLVRPMTEVLRNLGLKRVLVVHGSDGLDEVTTTGASFIGEYNGYKIRSFNLNPEDFKIKIAKPADLKGGDLNTNAHIAKDILDGQQGPKRDIVVLNAACAIYIAQAAKNIAEGIELACEAIDTGNARQKLEELIKFTNSVR